MMKFEIGTRYYDNGLAYEITGRTAKTIKFVKITHFGRFNEKVSEERKAKLRSHTNNEYFFDGSHEVEPEYIVNGTVVTFKGEVYCPIHYEFPEYN